MPAGARLFPVFWRRVESGGRISVNGRKLATGSAGAQGASAAPGFLDVGSVPAAGGSSVVVKGASATPTAYDATLVQPEVEWLLLANGAGSAGQGVLRSFATTRETRSVTLPGTGRSRPAPTRPAAAWWRS